MIALPRVALSGGALMLVSLLLGVGSAHAAGPASELGLKAQARLDAADPGEAEALINRALAADATDPDANVAAARLALLRDDVSRAKQLLGVALTSSPRHGPALVLLVRAHAISGDTQQLLPRYRELANTWRQDPAVQLAYAEALLAAGKGEDALKGATRVLKIDETSVAAMKLFARGHLALDRPVTAKSVIDRILESERDPEALALLAGIRHAEGSIIEARLLLEEAIGLMPGLVEALNSLGAIYVDVRNWESSVDVLQRATALAPRFAPVWVNYGCALRGAGSFTEAENAWRQALSLDAKSGDAWFNLGVLYLENPLPDRDRLQQLTDSVNAFNAAKRLGVDDSNTELYIDEARLLIKQETERRERERKAPATDGQGEG